MHGHLLGHLGIEHEPEGNRKRDKRQAHQLGGERSRMRERGSVGVVGHRHALHRRGVPAALLLERLHLRAKTQHESEGHSDLEQHGADHDPSDGIAPARRDATCHNGGDADKGKQGDRERIGALHAAHFGLGVRNRGNRDGKQLAARHHIGNSGLQASAHHQSANEQGNHRNRNVSHDGVPP